MKNFRISVFVLSLMFFTMMFVAPTFTPTYAQPTSCSCSNTTCNASQTCPNGYIASCTCEATGCSSECKQGGGGGIGPEFPMENLVSQNLENTSPSSFGKILSDTYDKSITFEPRDKNFRFDFKFSKASEGSHWDIFEYLDQNGELKINGLDLEFWKNRRNTLINGGEFAFCSSSIPVNMVLREISFITGRRYEITSGDGNTKISGSVRGNILSEVLDSLSKAGSVTIVEK